jgi:hypothetical protein
MCRATRITLAYTPPAIPFYAYDATVTFRKELPSSSSRLLAPEAAVGLGTTEGGDSSFSAAKSALGSPGEGNVWDHIVEQSQMNSTRSGFLPEQIHNAENLQDVPTELNQIKANYYSSIRPFTNGMTVRNWLNGQSFEDQWNFGMQVSEDIWNGVIH